MVTLEEARNNIGGNVTYVPTHAKGDCSHPDCERGHISSVNDVYVFVRFPGQPNGQACRPEDLVDG